jgi:hypothetical protein
MVRGGGEEGICDRFFCPAKQLAGPRYAFKRAAAVLHVTKKKMIVACQQARSSVPNHVHSSRCERSDDLSRPVNPIQRHLCFAA